MAYKKKLTSEEFVKTIIDKELEIVDADIRYDDIIKLPKEEQEKLKWWSKYSFKTFEQFEEWKEFFYEKFYDWQPKSISKEMMKKEFSWINLMWGLKYDFPYEIIEFFKDPCFKKAYDFYKSHVPEYDINKSQINFTKSILNLYDKKLKKSFVSDFDDFYAKEKENIDAYFKNMNQYENDQLKEPVVLLILYALRKREPKTIELWPFSNSLLKEFLKIMNISTDVLT